MVCVVVGDVVEECGEFDVEFNCFWGVNLFLNLFVCWWGVCSVLCEYGVVESVVGDEVVVEKRLVCYWVSVVVGGELSFDVNVVVGYVCV